MTLLAVKPAFQGLDCLVCYGLDFNYLPALLTYNKESDN
jgi:hypothetical protein